MNPDLLQTLLLVVILALAGYIIYLHIQLIRKNLLIESIAKKLSGIEKEWKPGELKKFFSELHTLNLQRKDGEDKLFDEEVFNFITGNEMETKNYVHYTMEKEVAAKIIAEGFKFVDSFYKTALPVSGDKLDLLIKHNNKKFYGDYIVIISISHDLVKYYTNELVRNGVKNHTFENILTENPPVKNENSELVYLLPYQFIKGYINFRTGEIVSNPAFNPGFTAPGFIQNITALSK